MSVVSIYAVFANHDEAERIGRAMIEQRLAACVNVLPPIRSIYRWDGEVESSNEVAAIFKTSTEASGSLMTGIAAMHSYAVPCIVTWPIDKVLSNYAAWVEDSVG